MPQDDAPDQTTDRSALAAIVAAGVAGVLLIGAIAFVIVQSRLPGDRFAACREVVIAGGQKLGAPFALTDQTGATVTEAVLEDRPALIYFGYTFCPDVCPLDVVRNLQAIDILKAGGHDIRPIFITVDPGRDTVAALADYAANMDPDMLALTGDTAALKTLIAAYGGSFSRQDDDPEYYLMSHTTLTYLSLPGEGTVALFTRRLGPDELAEKTACYLDAV